MWRGCLLQEVVRDYSRFTNATERTGMATDYDAPRKNDDDHESIEAIKEGSTDGGGHGETDVRALEEAFGFASEAIPDDLDGVAVVPVQQDEFTCSECFIVKHHSLLSRKKKTGPVCIECD